MVVGWGALVGLAAAYQSGMVSHDARGSRPQPVEFATLAAREGAARYPTTS
jgi:hypothetical protein